MPEQKKLFLLDAMALIYRAFFAMSRNPQINSKGQNTSAILGFANTLLEILKKEQPTHIAVALKYDSLAMGAPKLIAKGAGNIAEKIKAIAREHDVPVVENKELARNLYKMVEIGQEIPVMLYHAVAEILAYIYKLKGHRAGNLT